VCGPDSGIGGGVTRLV